jgi:phospholipid transport system transporter-binding protein
MSVTGVSAVAPCGALDFATVPGIWREVLGWLGAAPAVTVDLQGVTRVDSAALAMIVDWIGAATTRNVQLTLRNPPPELLALARISDVAPLLARVTALAER